MSQRVPNCDVDDNNNIPTATKIPLLPNFNFISHEVPMLGYQVAELPCKKGQPSTTYEGSHGNLTATWYKPRTNTGTLESTVSQHVSENCYKLITVDALVPCSEQQGTQKAVESGRLGACEEGRFPHAVALEKVRKRAGVVARGTTTLELGGCMDCSVSGSETCRRELSVTFNSATMGSPENTTSSGKQCTRTTNDDDRYSISHRISQSEVPDEDFKAIATKVDKSSGSNKRIKANSVVHNQSERRRRDKINQRMKELQTLVPNSSKTDKASMLDEVIQYMKQLQAQVQMMNWMNMYTSMILPITLQQQQQQQQQQLMSMMMAQMGMDMSMGMGMGMSKDMVMNMNSMNIPGFPPMLPFPPFMPMAPCGDQLQGTPEKSVTMDAYIKMASLYQQLFHPPASSSKN